MFVCCECCVLSGRGFCDELITRPEESYCGVRRQFLGAVAYPGILFGGVQQIQLRTEDRENGDLGAVAP